MIAKIKGVETAKPIKRLAEKREQPKNMRKNVCGRTATQ